MLPTSYPSIKDQRSSRYTEDAVPSTSRSRSQEEFERQKRREEWKRQQELEMEHKRKKKQKIMEYERKRAHLLGLSPSRRCLSDSPPHTRSSPNQYLSTRKEKSNGERPLFKGPEGTPISSQELRRIKVDIRRLNISVKGPIPDIQRDIPNLDDVFIWRKYGEGTKPIFDRPEIKQRHGDNVIEDNGEKEHCTIMTIKDQSASTNKAQTSRKRSSSPSPSAIYYIYRDKSSSHSYTYSRSFTEDKYRYDRYRERSRERSRERRDIERDRNRDRGRDRYRDRGRDRNRDRDRDRNRDRNRDRDRYIERRDVENYIGPLQLYPDSLAFNSSRPIIPITDLMVPPIRGFARLPAPIREFARPSAPIRLPYLYPPMYKMNVPNLTHVPESTQWMHPEARPFTQRLSNN